MIYIILFAIWYAVGLLSIIFWWYITTTVKLPIRLAILVGLWGVFAFFIGWFIHAQNIPLEKE